METKALKAAELYYKTENFRAAAFSYKNLLIDYPDIDNPEEIQYKVVKSFYKYAEQSIVTKQQERYEEAILYAGNFLGRYKTSSFTNNVKETKENAHLLAIKGSLSSAMVASLDRRDNELKEVFDVYTVHSALIEDPKVKLAADEIKEETQFELIRTYFSQAQEAELADREKFYVETIKAYSEFINTYKESKYNKEAEKIFNASQKNIKKSNNG